MKKYLITILVLLSMLIVQVGTVVAAPMASGTIALVSVQYVPGKGPVFTFSVTGKFSRAELKGSLHAEGGADYGLHCTQVDKSTVKCSTSAKVSGVNAVLSWGGSTFWTFVPEAPAQFCYSVYDWNTPSPFVEWVNYGTHCQETPAHYGDTITWYNPGWDDTFHYEFLPESPDSDVCSFNHPDEAYYYPNCPL